MFMGIRIVYIAYGRNSTAFFSSQNNMHYYISELKNKMEKLQLGTN